MNATSGYPQRSQLALYPPFMLVDIECPVMNRKDNIQVLSPDAFPPLLREIIDPPTRLFLRGTLPTSDFKYLCIVGSRSYSPYGKDVCERLISGLAGYPVVIVSGLALGIDAIAHAAALRCGLPT